MRKKKWLALLLSASMLGTAVHGVGFAQESAGQEQQTESETETQTEQAMADRPSQESEDAAAPQEQTAPAPEPEQAPAPTPESARPQAQPDSEEPRAQAQTPAPKEVASAGAAENGKARDEEQAKAEKEGVSGRIGEASPVEDSLEEAAKENFLKLGEQKAFREDGEIKVVLVSETDEYDTLYFGLAADEKKEPAITGEKNLRGGYTYVLSVPEALLGQIVPYVPKRAGGAWYYDKALYLRLPESVTELSEEEIIALKALADEAHDETEAQTAPAEEAAPEETEAEQIRAEQTEQTEQTADPQDPALFLRDRETAAADQEQEALAEERKTQTIDEETAEKAEEMAEGQALAVTNTTGMFKVVDAHIRTKDGAQYLTVTLSAQSYHYLFKGVYEEAVKNGNDRTNWISGYQVDGKWVFDIPYTDGESKIAIVSISSTKLAAFESGTAQIESAFYPRQLVVDARAGTLVAGDYDDTYDITVSSRVDSIRVADTASMHVVGGPNSNNYACTPVLTMLDHTYDIIQYPTVNNGKVITDSAAISDETFTLVLKNEPGVTAFENEKSFAVSLHDSATREWVEAYCTIDMLGRTLTISAQPLEDGDEEHTGSGAGEGTGAGNSGAGGSKAGSGSSGSGAGGTGSGSSGNTGSGSLGSGSTGSGSKGSGSSNAGGSNSGSTGSGSKGSGSSGSGSTGSGSSAGSRGGTGSGAGGSGGGYTANTSGSTVSVDSSTELKDGDYAPDSFSFSGGSGKMNISCQKITVSGGAAYATLLFSSGKIIYVKADGKQYAPAAQSADTSTYQVPVTLNANMKILACTTAMSVPHEVEYTIYVGLEAAREAKGSSSGARGSGSGVGDTSGIKAGGTSGGKGGAKSGKPSSNGLSGEKVTAVSSAAGSAVLAAGGSLTADEGNAPSVPGLSYEGSYSNEHARYFRLHFYEDEFEVLEISLAGAESAGWNEQDQADGAGDSEDSAASAPQDKTDGAADVADAEEGGSASQQAPLYDGNVLRYLIAPEGKDLPAGIDKEMIVVTLPVTSAYVDSDPALRMLENLEAYEGVSAVGISRGACTLPGLAAAMDAGGIETIGHYDEDSAYVGMVLKQTDLAIFPGDLRSAAGDDGTEELISEAAPEETLRSSVKDLGDGMAILKIPMVVDRSADEKEELARYEWLMVYGALFGRESRAGEAYQAAKAALEKETPREADAEQAPSGGRAADETSDAAEDPSVTEEGEP